MTTTETRERGQVLTKDGLARLQKIARRHRDALGKDVRVRTRMAGPSEGFHDRPQEIILLDYKGYTLSLGWTEAGAAKQLLETIRSERAAPSIPAPRAPGEEVR